MRIVIAFLLFLFVGPAFAQDAAEQAERNYLVGLVEDQISTPNMQFRLNDIQGALSSDATIGEITIADRQGVWLKISNARIVWTRSALLLGRLSIDTLRADRIDVLRKPLPEEGLPPAETKGFSVPELPVSVSLGQLQVDRATFGPDVFGLQSELSLAGRLQLADGSLDTALDVTRLDGPGGKLTLAASYANASKELGLDLNLSEPANGVVANLLGVDGRPPMVLAVKGAGPIDSLNVTLTLDADQQRVLTGATALSRRDEGLGFATTLEGPISRLVAPVFRDFFGAESKLVASGVVRDAGGVLVEELDLASGALTLKGNAETAADGFLRKLKLDADIADANAQKVVLPVAGGESSVDRASFDVSFGEAGEEWSGKLAIDGLETGTFTSKAVTIDLGGLAQNLDQPTERRLTFAAKGAATGIEAERADIAEALGKQVDLDIEGAWVAGQPLELPKALLTGNGLSLSLVGTIAERIFHGDIDVKAASITPFSELAGRELKGALDLKAKGQVTPIGGGFDLVLDGSGKGLEIGQPAADNLIEGTTRITGRVARGEQGLVTDKLRLFNDQADILADGRYATGEADFDLNVELSDLALLSERAGGRMTAAGKAQGRDGVIALRFNADVPEGTLADKRLREATLVFDGFARNEGVDGKITGNAFLEGNRVSLTGDVATAPTGKSITNLRFDAGGLGLTGDVRQDVSGLLDGKLSLKAADVSTAAALALVNASGAVNADINLSQTGGKQQADITGSVANLVADQVRIKDADIKATLADLFNVPVINGSIRANGVTAGGVNVTRLDATAASQGEATNFTATAALDNGANIGTKGALAPESGGYRVRLEALDLNQGKLSARLAEPASVLVQGQNVTVDAFTLDAGGGRVSAKGVAAETLDLNVEIAQLPLSIANAIKPDLALGGTLDGTARIGGTRKAPDIQFNINGRELSAAALKKAGLSALTVDAKGTSTTDLLNLDASVSSPEGLRASARGGVPLGDGQLGLDIDLNAFPLAVLNAVAPGQDLSGTITGTARVTGTKSDPAASFDIKGTGIGAKPLKGAGLVPLEIAAAGKYGEKAVTLSSAAVCGPQGFSLDGSGRIPLAGSGLNVNVTGDAPLSLANRFLAERGAQATGNLSLTAAVSGSLDKPSVRGMFSTQGARFVDPESNLRLNDIAVLASIDGEQVTLRNVSAAIASGGRVSATGTISTNAAAGFPGDIRVTLDQARYADGNMVVATVNGALRFAGPLTRDPTLSGNIDVLRAEVTVPDSLGSNAAQIDVKHKRASKEILTTLKRAKANDDGTPVPTSRPSVVRMNVTVNAPNKIFVRGRGLDSELGGKVTLTGPVTDIQPVGGFKLIRGRLGILGQRIEFDEGTVTLVGDLDPFIDFVARSGDGDITVFINVKGRVSDLDISFSSQPELPQDEVLARLIFNRSINELSAFQIAQLAAAAAELAGGQNTSLLGSLRQATGLDDLDVVTDSKGNAGVRAGRYINDNIYLGVEAGAGGKAKGTINLDITDNLKAKGSVGSDGDSGVGVFYEKDY